MQYVISDGEHYLKKEDGGYTIVDDIGNATVWDMVKEVNKVQKNMSKKLRRGGFQVRKVEDYELAHQTEEVELDFDILEKVDEIYNLAKQAERRAAYLNEQIRRADLIIVDIEHAAEFYNLNASRGYKLYKMLHDVRIKRRELKNELNEIRYFLDSKTSSSGMENLKKRIKGIDNQKYRPRVINELFGV